MASHGPWFIYGRTEKYESDRLNVHEDQVQKPDGSDGVYATVTLKPGVAVLPIDAGGQVHLTRQFRYAVGRDTVEVPSGTLEPGEDPLDGAKREIQEELGIQADQWQHLGRVDVDTSIVMCSVDLFIAQRLHFTETDQDSTELIRPLTIALETAIHMVTESEITHSPSCVLILKAERCLRQGDAR
jgi:ADP-ribose pyrophosphatase YjhB (NUDIX family)